MTSCNDKQRKKLQGGILKKTQIDEIDDDMFLLLRELEELEAIKEAEEAALAEAEAAAAEAAAEAAAGERSSADH